MPISKTGRLKHILVTFDKSVLRELNKLNAEKYPHLSRSNLINRIINQYLRGHSEANNNRGD